MKRAIAIVFLMCTSTAFAHVGTTDVYMDGYAGPYHLLVTVRPPGVIPGVADIQIRVLTPGVNELRIVPTRIVGQGSDMAPVPDVARQSKEDPQLYTGKLWIMLRGSWKVRIDATGNQGAAQLSVPIAAVAQFPLPMKKYMGLLLSVLGFLLVVGAVSIVGASVREAKLQPGDVPDQRSRTRARIAMTVASLFAIAILWLSNGWWNAEAAQNRQGVYETPRVQVKLEGNKLLLHLQNSNGRNWSEPLRMTDFVPDHGHLMHLFLVRMPQMDVFAHLHPEHVELGNFIDTLPPMQPGHYKVFADIVHATGFPETYVGEVDLPAISSGALQGDDSVRDSFGANSDTSDLGDGYRMIWEEPAGLKTNELAWLKFKVVDKNGQPAEDLEPYMGMAAHALFVNSDGSVFAHVHPSGSVPMASIELAQGGHVPPPEMAEMAGMPGMNHATDIDSEVSFPWGFPRPGSYRIFVQVKRAGHVDTGVFEAAVQ